MKLLAVTGSARPVSLGTRVGAWINNVASKDTRFESVELVSVADLDLPLFNENFSPKYRHYTGDDYTNAAGKAWAERVAAADAFIFITPEYNYSVPGGFKNALDWVGGEWAGKTVGLVGYSVTQFGGVRAVEHLRQIAPELGLTTVIHHILIGDAANAIDEDGTPKGDALDGPLSALLDELASAPKKS